MLKVYTKTGDEGETALLFGRRVSKADPRCEAYGAVDSAISAMGLARALCASARVKELLLKTQRELFDVGSELATDAADHERLRSRFAVVTPEMVDDMERAIDEVQAQVSLPRAFLVPGGSPGSGALDLARSLLRTSERRVVSLHEAGRLSNLDLLRYLNRASDLLFMLARLEDIDLPFELARPG